MLGKTKSRELQIKKLHEKEKKRYDPTIDMYNSYSVFNKVFDYTFSIVTRYS